MKKFWIFDFGFSIGRSGRNKIFSLALGALFFAICFSAAAQQPKKVPRIGFLGSTSFATNTGRREAFRQGLRELGYVEGKNIVIEWRFADGKAERLPSLVAELVALKADVIVTGGSAVTGAAKEATVTTPIVMAQDNDPVGSGFVASLARPAGNITGLSILAPELSTKQLELLKETVPRLSRVAVLGTSTRAGNAKVVKATELAAGALDLQLHYLDIRNSADIEAAFGAISKRHLEAILVLDSTLRDYSTKVAELALKSRVPASYFDSTIVEKGGLMSYAANISDLARRAASYVDKILRGAKPADLPVEQPTKFEFVINLRTAKQIGLTIPQSVLFRADRVIR